MESLPGIREVHLSSSTSTSTSTETRDLVAEHQGLQLSFRTRLIMKLSKKIPYTSDGLPVGFYRLDLLPFLRNESNMSSIEVDEAVNNALTGASLDDIRNAFVDLNFDLGYPTLSNGLPYWERLSFEPNFAYGVFQAYLEMINLGPRELLRLANEQELRILAYSQQIKGPNANLSIEKEACDLDAELRGEEVTKMMPVEDLVQILYEYMHLYNWRHRAHAYDVYKEASYRHLRLKRQSSTEDMHFVKSQVLLEGLINKMSQPKFMTELSDTAAVALLDKLVKIQRISIGLPAAGPLAARDTPEDTTFEYLLRSMSRKTVQGNNDSGHETREALDAILGDGAATTSLQEMVLRVSRASIGRAQGELQSAQKFNQFQSRERAESGRSERDLDAELRSEIPYDISRNPES